MLNHILSTLISHAIAVNLSTSTIKNSRFRLWLKKLIKKNQFVTKQLVFSFSAYAVAKNLDTYLDFIDVLYQWGGRVMIKRFETQSMSPDVTKKLNPDFIMIARYIGDGISLSKQKYEFVQSMQELGGLLDIAVHAENVQGDNDCYSFKAIGIAGVCR